MSSQNLKSKPLVATLLVSLAVLMLLPTVASGQGRQIADISIIGNDRVSQEAIMAVIGLAPGMDYSEEAVQKAREAIRNMGYFSTVTAGIESLDSGVKVIFNVVENPIIRDIKISGNTAISTETLRTLMRSTLDSVLNSTTLQQDLLAIENYYSEQGYIATVTEDFGIDPETGILTIPILEVKVEDIRITGNKKTKTRIILREMQLKPGDVFNRKVLFEDIRRIYDLQIFDIQAAQPYTLESGSELGLVIVTIPVIERKTGEISIGIAYSSRQKLVGQAKLTETNFRGRAQTVNLMWEQSSDRGASYEVGFFEPWLDSKHTSLGLNLYNKLIYRFSSNFLGGGTDISDYNERRKGGSTTLSRPFGLKSRGFFTLRSESVDTGDFSSQISSSGSVTSGTMRFTKSSRNSEISPTEGLYSSFAVELGNADFQKLGEDFTDIVFTKYSGDTRLYLPLKKISKEEQLTGKLPPVLAFRLMGGTLTGNVPFFEQYFLGGAETLRGYREDRFWGKNILLASTECRIPVAQSLVGVVFVDVGDAWGAQNIFRIPPENEEDDPELTELLTAMPQHESFSPRIGYGIGLRVVTPIGPLRLDYGFGDEGSRAHFSFGHAF